MKEFWQSVIRFASLGVIIILLYFGVDLIKNTKDVSWAGSGLIFVGITLAVISFMDWRKREDYEHLIKQQSGVIKDLTAQIHEAKKTDAMYQKNTRDSINTTDDRLQPHAGDYAPDMDNSTQDI